MLAAIALIAASLLPSISIAATPPDIIVFLVDDLGRSSFNKLPDSATRNVDEIARQGVSFKWAYAEQECVPARTDLMSGLYHARFGIQGNGPQPPGSMVTIAEKLKLLGYHTAMVGKWHLGFSASQQPGAQGFDEALVYIGATPGYTITTQVKNAAGYDVRLYRQIGNTSPKVVNVTPLLGQLTTTVLGDEAVRIVSDRTRTTPLFLYMPWTGVHDPLQGTLTARFTEVDQQIGRIIAAARPGTLFIVLGDNGRGNESPLRGKKYQIYEGGVGTFAFARFDGHVVPGSIVTTPVSIVDIPATIYAAATGGAVLPGTDGFNWFGLPADRAILFDAPKPSPGLGVRQGDYKYYADLDGKAQQLYNLSIDPNETTNIAGANPGIVAKMEALLETYRRNVLP